MAHTASLSPPPDAAPPSAEGCLDSITVHTIEQIAGAIGVPFERRPLERTELLVARECGVAGTISELTLVAEVEGSDFDQSGLHVQVRQAYLKAMRGDITVDDVAMVPLV